MKTDKIWVGVKRISLFFLFSLFLHLVALLTVPDFLKPARLPFIPVVLIKATDLYVESIQRSGELGDGDTGMWERSPVQQIRDEVVLRKLSEMGLSQDHTPSLPKTNLSPTEKSDDHETIRILETSRFYQELEEMMQRENGQSKVYDVPRPKTKDVKGGDLPLLQDNEAERIIASLREEVKGKEGTKKDLPEPALLDIQGPVASRKISYIPPAPQVKISVEADVLLKFWVLPDGTVGRVIPLVKGDTRVDIAAISHIKKYRFSALPKDVPQVEMWGVIPVKSVLR